MPIPKMSSLCTFAKTNIPLMKSDSESLVFTYRRWTDEGNELCFAPALARSAFTEKVRCCLWQTQLRGRGGRSSPRAPLCCTGACEAWALRGLAPLSILTGGHSVCAPEISSYLSCWESFLIEVPASVLDSNKLPPSMTGKILSWVVTVFIRPECPQEKLQAVRLA